jgi:hypothetical protein
MRLNFMPFGTFRSICEYELSQVPVVEALGEKKFVSAPAHGRDAWKRSGALSLRAVIAAESRTMI